MALAGGKLDIPPHCQVLMQWVAKFVEARDTKIPLNTLVKTLHKPGMFPSEELTQMMEHVATFVYANAGSTPDALKALYGGVCMGSSGGKERGQ